MAESDNSLARVPSAVAASDPPLAESLASGTESASAIGWRESTYRYFPALRPPPPTGRLNLAFIVVGFPLAVVLIFVGLDTLSGEKGWIKFLFVLAGLVALYLAFVSLLRRTVGAEANIGMWFASSWMGLIVVGAVTAGILPLAESKKPSKTLQEPVLGRPDLFSKHPLGTDRQGLDMLGGVVYGLRTSLIIGLGVVFLGLLIGGTIGLIAGYNRGRLDQTLEFFTNSMLAFPPLILLMGVAAVMERNILNITLALTVVSIPTYVRLARANTMVIGQREFVLAARALGLRNRTILTKDIAPNVMKPLLSYAFVVTAVIIVAEASLSFLGLGIPRPEPTLGNMIASGQSDFDTVPHLVFVPATALFLTVLSLNRLGEEAQRRWSGS